jgi:hypothetical protein
MDIFLSPPPSHPRLVGLMEDDREEEYVNDGQGEDNNTGG